MSDGRTFAWSELDLLIPRPRPQVRYLTAEDILGPGAVAAPAVERRRERPALRVPPLVEARDPVLVEIDAFSLGAIERAVDDAGRDETGGWLFAHARPHDGYVPVVHATASPVVQTPASVRLADVSAVERDFSDTLRRAEFVVCGNWHSEPRCNDLPTPSETDRLSWAEGLEDSGAEFFAGLVYAGNRLHAFAARRDTGGCVVVEPALIQDV